MENNIKIVRFKDGIDVICKITVEEELGIIDIEDPMEFQIHNANLMIQQWLPIAVAKENKVRVRINDVLCIYEPNNSFQEYYEGLVSKINEVVESNDVRNASVEKIKELIEALEEIPSDGTLVH